MVLNIYLSLLFHFYMCSFSVAHPNSLVQAISPTFIYCSHKWLVNNPAYLLKVKIRSPNLRPSPLQSLPSSTHTHTHTQAACQQSTLCINGENLATKFKASSPAVPPLFYTHTHTYVLIVMNNDRNKQILRHREQREINSRNNIFRWMNT